MILKNLDGDVPAFPQGQTGAQKGYPDHEILRDLFCPDDREIEEVPAEDIHEDQHDHHGHHGDNDPSVQGDHYPLQTRFLTEFADLIFCHKRSPSMMVWVGMVCLFFYYISVDF
jgi:hypothetical protein